MPRLRAALVAVALTVSAAPAMAAKPQPTTIGPVTSAPATDALGNPFCLLGVFGPAAGAYGYILPPDDGYYTLLDPQRCPTLCGNGAYFCFAAHMELYFTEPCEIPVTVQLVAAQETQPGCWAPNPFAPLCQPAQSMINDGGQLNTCVNYMLAFAPGCCFQGTAFMLIEFDQGTCANSRPAFCTPAACDLCTQYNFYPGVIVPGDDLCAVLAPFGLHGNIMYANIECCQPPNPTTTRSWGKLKTSYR
jgi:hypothetical protein